MNRDQREILQRLFVVATEHLETAHEAAVAGQSAGLAQEDYVAVANGLRTASQSLATLADAILVIAAQADCEPDIGAKDPH
jgi:hypothetical protein